MKQTVFMLSLLIGIGTLANAQSDGSHQLPDTEKTAINKVLDDYLTTFNARDLKGWENTYQFPHYRLASGKMSVLEKAGLRDSTSVFGPLQKRAGITASGIIGTLFRPRKRRYMSTRSLPDTEKMAAKWLRMSRSTY